MEKPIYTDSDVAGKTPVQVADIIAAWREDDGQLAGASFDLLNVIEPYLRGYCGSDKPIYTKI